MRLSLFFKSQLKKLLLLQLAFILATAPTLNALATPQGEVIAPAKSTISRRIRQSLPFIPGISDATIAPKKISPFTQYVAQTIDANADPRLNKKEANLFTLQTQEIIVATSNGEKRFNPSEIQLEIATPFIDNVETELRYNVTPDGGILIHHIATGLEQQINELDSVSIDVDEHFIFSIDSQGVIKMAPNKMMKGLLFQSPIPFFTTGKIAEDALRPDGNYKLQIIKTNSAFKLAPALEARLKPPTGQKARIMTGSIGIFDENGLCIDILERAPLVNTAYFDGVVLSLLTAITDPKFFESENEIRQLLKDHLPDIDKIKSRLNDPQLRAALSQESMSNTFRDMSTATIREGLERLKLLRESLNSGFEPEQLLVEKAERNLEDLLKRRIAIDAEDQKITEINKSLGTVIKDFSEKAIAVTRDKWGKALTRENMRRLAYTLAALGGVAGANALTGDVASHWALGMIAKAWESSAPEVLLSHDWAMPSVRTMLYVDMQMPIIIAAASIASMKTKLSMKRTIMTTAIRAFGLAQGSIYLFTQMNRQKILYPAIRQGINPFKYREAFNSPFASDAQIVEHRQSLESKFRKEHRAQAFGWLIAHAYVMKTKNIDPLTLLKTELDLAEGRSGDSPENAKTEAEENKLWAYIAQELSDVFQAQNDLHDLEDLRSLTDEQLLGYLKMAEEIHLKMQNENQFEKQMRIHGAHLTKIWNHTVPSFIGEVTFDRFKRLMQVKPGHVISDQLFRKWITNTVFSAGLNGFIGPRADLSAGHQRDLTAGVTHADGQTVPGVINPEYATEVLDDTFAEEFMNTSGEMILTLDEGAREQAYLPKPDLTNARQATAKETLKGLWKTAINLPRLDLGNYLLANAQTILLTAPAGFLPGFFVRLATFSPGDAIKSQIWTMAMTLPSYLFYYIFWDRLPTLHSQDVTDLYLNFYDTQVRLVQALERNDLKEAERVGEKIKLYYSKFSSELTLPKPSGNTAEDLQALYDFSIATPAVPYKPNESVMMGTAVAGALGGLMLANKFDIKSYDTSNHHWGTQMLWGLGEGAGFTALAVVTQEGINRIWNPMLKLRDAAVKKIRGAKNTDKSHPEIHNKVIRKKGLADWCNGFFNRM